MNKKAASPLKRMILCWAILCSVTAFADITSSEQIEKLKKERIPYQHLFIPGNPNIATKAIDKIAGVYKHKTKLKIYEGKGEEYWGENILEIVRVTDDVIYFNLSLAFDNGHACAASGLAHYKKEGFFLFADEGKVGDQECLLKIIPTAEGISFQSFGACGGYCGARGCLDCVKFSTDKRRPIRYMKILLNSQGYKDAMKNAEE